jgi:hypothetical protein
MALAQFSNVLENLYYNACEGVFIIKKMIAFGCNHKPFKQIVSQNQQFILLTKKYEE